jgi:hypothetical protein
LQRWLGALTGSSRVSEEGFPQGRACFEDGRSFPMRCLFGCLHRASSRGFAIVAEFWSAIGSAMAFPQLTRELLMSGIEGAQNPRTRIS